MRNPWRRRSVWEVFSEGAERYDVVFARLGTDIETVAVMADNPEQAIQKAERYLQANIYPRTIITGGVHVWPPGAERVGMTIAEAEAAHAGRAPEGHLTDLTRPQSVPAT